jgi:hypothetical protein
MGRLARLARGLPAVSHHRFAADFRYDLVTGVANAVTGNWVRPDWELPSNEALDQLAAGARDPTSI